MLFRSNVFTCSCDEKWGRFKRVTTGTDVGAAIGALAGLAGGVQTEP